MPSEKVIVHVIDDDEASRQSLAFLLQTAQIEVQTYASAAMFLDLHSRRRLELRHHRRAHAGHERHRSAEAT